MENPYRICFHGPVGASLEGLRENRRDIRNRVLTNLFRHFAIKQRRSVMHQLKGDVGVRGRLGEMVTGAFLFSGFIFTVK